jgi:hypothetical protein
MPSFMVCCVLCDSITPLMCDSITPLMCDSITPLDVSKRPTPPLYVLCFDDGHGMLHLCCVLDYPDLCGRLLTPFCHH